MNKATFAAYGHTVKMKGATTRQSNTITPTPSTKDPLETTNYQRKGSDVRIR